MRNSNVLVLASTNRHKFEEFMMLFKPYPDIQLAPIQEYIRNSEKLESVETSDHYYDNAIAKARMANHACHYPCLADDSGIEVDFLNGRPGVRSHRYAIAKAGQTQDQANIQKMLDEMKGAPADKRHARFLCHLALVMEGTLIHEVGVMEGTLATEPRGTLGFGYDPIFIPRGYDKTLAELGPEIKNKISHRFLAVQGFMDEVKKQEIIFAKP